MPMQNTALADSFLGKSEKGAVVKPAKTHWPFFHGEVRSPSALDLVGPLPPVLASSLHGTFVLGLQAALREVRSPNHRLQGDPEHVQEWDPSPPPRTST